MTLGNLLRLPTWPNTWSILVTVSCVLIKNVFSLLGIKFRIIRMVQIVGICDYFCFLGSRKGMLNSPGVIFDLSICPCSSSFIVCSFSFIGSWSTSTHGDLFCLVLLSTMKHFLFLSCIKYCFTFSIFRNYGYESNFLLVHICLNVLCFYPFIFCLSLSL